MGLGHVMRGEVTRTPIRFLLVLSAMAVALLIPTSAFAINWAPVTGPTSSIQEVAKVRSADGTLHVVWTRDHPGVSTQDVFHVAISAGGVVETPTEIAAGFSIAGNPAIVNLPSAGGSRCSSGASSAPAQAARKACSRLPRLIGAALGQRLLRCLIAIRSTPRTSARPRCLTGLRLRPGLPRQACSSTEA